MSQLFEPQFRMDVVAQPADIDELGHVNNTVYLRWVQDIATAHWRAVAPPEMQAASVWVVLRHEIDYSRPALEGDALDVLTRVGEPDGARFDRFVRIERAGLVLAQARTIWVHVDASSRRPKRVPPEMAALFAPNTPMTSA
jgi:acyl-CoA thioester hydrolase